MNGFVLFLGLALGVSVLLQALKEIVPVHVPTIFNHTVAAAVAALAAWALTYSVFAAAHTPVRASWLGYVATGLALVGTGELLRSAWPALVGHRVEKV